MSLFSLDGRVALVSGTSRGLGLAMAQALAAAGFFQTEMAAPILGDLTLLARGAPTLQET